MIRLWRKLLSIFTAKERLQIYLLLFNATVMALIEVAGLASIMPFIAVVLDPSLIDSNPHLHTVYAALEFTNHAHFQVFLGVFSLIMLVAGNAFAAFSAWFLFRFCFLRTHSLCVRLMAKYLHEPYLQGLQRSRAELQKIIVTNVDRVLVGTLMAAIGLFADLVSAAFMLTVLFLVDPMVTAFTLVVLGLSYLAVFLTIRKRVTELGEEFVGLETEIVGRTQEALDGMKEIKVFRRENAFVRRLADPRYRFAINAIRHSTLELIPSHLIEIVAFGIIIVITLYYLLNQGASSGILAVIALYAFAAYRLVPTLKEIFEGVDSIRYNAPALEAIHKDFDLLRYGSRGAAPFTSRPLQLGIDVRDVTFSYHGRHQPALHQLTLSIPAAQLTCVMGPTGAGKSTAIDLILGLLKPESGSIRIDGRPLESDTDWLASIGYVPQTINLFEGSIASNIAFGLPAEQIDRARVEAAARQARIHEFIVNELPEGYDSTVGERGMRLSGGQRQRLGLARAFYGDPQVLILDEATNALDPQTEREIIEGLLALRPPHTIVFVSHKTSIARYATQIIILQEGRKLAQGTYDELRFDPRFRELVTDA